MIIFRCWMLARPRVIWAPLYATPTLAPPLPRSIASRTICAMPRCPSWLGTRSVCRFLKAASISFFHHFSDEEIVRLLGSFGSIARRAVLAIDLERGPLAYHFMPATRWLFGWHDISMHDGPVSVQAAFKRDELAALAKKAGLSKARVSTHRPWARLSLVAPL